MKVIDLSEGMRFGVGVDGLTEEARGTAIDYDDEVDGALAGGGLTPSLPLGVCAARQIAPPRG
jgi:hypothetical protein